MKLKPYEIRLIAHCLRIAADEFGNHGCNDFDLTDNKLHLSKKNRRELVLRMAVENGDEDEIQWLKERPTPKWTQDWRVMSFFAAILSGADIPEAPPESESEEVARLKKEIHGLKNDVISLQSRLDFAKDKMQVAVNSL